LIKFIGLKGGVINLLNNRSGTGKSTILQVMNSVWGHPDHLMIQWRDTLNVKLHRMAVMCNLPVGVDEVTKMSADNFSDLAYCATQGTPPRRMKASTNEERDSQGFWATLMVAITPRHFSTGSLLALSFRPAATPQAARQCLSPRLRRRQVRSG
jgi:energy-coupling factor transporter ATP-binding protein EcfA2